MRSFISCALLLSFFSLQTITASQATPSAQKLSASDQCHTCQMVITRYPGPKGEIIQKDSQVLKFCSTREMLCFATSPSNQPKIAALYVHDLARTSWESPDDESFIEAQKAWFVYGTTKKAVMGPAVGTFSTEAAAKKFAETWGGAVYRFTDISPEFLGCRVHRK